MANFKRHAAVGAGVGAGLNLLWQISKIMESQNPPTNLGELLQSLDLLQVASFAALGAACASLPDILEPATSPNHRAVFHSLACGGAVTYGAFGKHTDRLHPDTALTIQTMALSYLSHLALDGTTPKGLPLIA
jgi:membrane-bound metal-dependent hydrolase YbcI (DUF457 family)